MPDFAYSVFASSPLVADWNRPYFNLHSQLPCDLSYCERVHVLQFNYKSTGETRHGRRFVSERWTVMNVHKTKPPLYFRYSHVPWCPPYDQSWPQGHKILVLKNWTSFPWRNHSLANTSILWRNHSLKNINIIPFEKVFIREHVIPLETEIMCSRSHHFHSEIIYSRTHQSHGDTREHVIR